MCRLRADVWAEHCECESARCAIALHASEVSKAGAF